MGNCSATIPSGVAPTGYFDLNQAIMPVLNDCRTRYVSCSDLNFNFNYNLPGWYELFSLKAIEEGDAGATASIAFSFTSTDPNYPCSVSMPTPGSCFFYLSQGNYSIPFITYAMTSYWTTISYSGVMTFTQTPYLYQGE